MPYSSTAIWRLAREGASILPNYDIAIMDEAHTLEAVAGDHLGLGVTSSQIDYLLSRLYNDRNNRGLLVHYKLVDAQRLVMECRDRASDFFGAIDDWLNRQAGGNGRVREAEIVPNPLSSSLEKLARAVRKAGDDVKSKRNGRTLFLPRERLTARSPPSNSKPGARSRWPGRFRLLGPGTDRLAPRAAAVGAERCTDRRWAAAGS